jgi:hypothetical protein
MLRRLTPLIFVVTLASPILLQTGCTQQNAVRAEYQMGEKVTIGPLTYTVIETKWPSQLGDVLKLRLPERRFLMISLSVTSGAGHPLTLPLLSVEGSNGHLYQESENGEGLNHWLGMLRNLNPSDTAQGQILFDVPLGSYRLRVPDGGEPGAEKYAWVEIPLHLDPSETVTAPTPGKQ